ncbi:MAG: hypothetical protein ACREAA_12345 [Candidatus Polarisedimenticolia bacterium]
MKERLAPLPVLGMALALALIYLAPTLQGEWSALPPRKVFLGFRYMAGDHYQYAAFIREARDTGSMLMDNPFTTRPQTPVFLFPFFWVVGMAARLIGGSIPLAWDLFRAAGAFAYVLVFWRFAALFFARRPERLAATAVFAFGGGFDWIVTVLRGTVLPAARPLEHPITFFWNWSTFGTALMPNWSWPALVLMAGSAAWLRGPRGGSWLMAGILPLVWLMHAYTGMVAYLVVGLFPIVPAVVALARLERPAMDRSLAHLKMALPGLLSFVMVAAYLEWARQDDVFRQLSGNGFLWTVRFSLAWYPLSYGLLLPFALYGIVVVSRERSRAGDFLLAWLAAAVLLSVNPWYAGVKFQYLVFPPLCVLAVRGFFDLRSSKAGFRRLTRNPVVVVAGLMLLFLNGPVSLWRDLPRPGVEPIAFAPQADVNAMTWLASRPQGGVFCHHRTGNYIPWLAGKNVFSGHWFMTPDYKDTVSLTEAFYKPQTPLEEKRRILRSSGSHYVYRGWLESKHGDVDPALGLARIYDQDGVSIWEVPGAR